MVHSGRGNAWLRTEDENKLSQVLSQQRRYQQQLHHKQQHHHSQGQLQHQQQQSFGLKSGESYTEPGTLDRESSVYSSQSVDGSTDSPLHVDQLGRRQVWTSVTDSSHTAAASSRERLTSHPDSLALQDVASDSDARSSISLLESESVYLPFDVPASPLVLRRPFTAPQPSLKSSSAPSNLHDSPASTSKPPEFNHYLHRPATASEPRENKYDQLEQRPIKPLNQHIKPSFDIALPRSSNLEPSSHISTHREEDVPTARSQDYESSSEQTVSESEPPPSETNKFRHHCRGGEDERNSPRRQEERGVKQSAPKDKLNHIKSIAGSKKVAGLQSQVLKLKEKSSAASQVRSTTLTMKTATNTNTTTTTTTTTSATASSMATSAVMRARMNKMSSQGPTAYSAGKLSSKGGSDRSKLTHHNINTNSNETSTAHSPTSKAANGDSKQMKGRLNLERMELKKDGSSLGSVRDSGFLSRPSSDAVMEDSQQMGVDIKAATSIQAFWRGYWAREHNTKVVSVRKEIRARRAEDHITLLRKDLERNRKLYEEEKRLRILQMEAIRLLYQEVQVLKSQNLSSSKDLNGTSGHNSNATGFSPASTGASIMSGTAASSTGYSELNRTQELERTCAGLQTQVTQLQEALESVSSAVFRTNSLDGAIFDFTDNSESVQVSPYQDSRQGGGCGVGEASHWSCIPHSLSPYPSEEEESYFLQVPTQGAPTPPRRLELRHHSRSAFLLTWQPSSCLGNDMEEEGNRHIIGYRVYVNDQLKAFICQRTSALVDGLNPHTTYKIYVKALSGFGESFESDILMAKLAKGAERKKYFGSSGSDSSHDSDKDVDSTENMEKRRKNRKTRKSPRLTEKKATSSHKLDLREGLSELPVPPDVGRDNQNNSASMTSPILMHAKLHTHRRTRSRDLQIPSDSGEVLNGTTSKENSPAAGTASGKPSSSKMVNTPSHTHPQVSPSSGSALKKESSRKLPESPATGSKREQARDKEVRVKANQEAIAEKLENLSQEEVNAAAGTTSGQAARKKSSPSQTNKESPPSSLGRRESPTHSRRKESASASDAPQSGSSNVSPACGSDADHRVRISPKAGGEPVLMKQPSPPCGASGVREVNQSSNMSETFTIEKASSFLENVNAIAESALAGRMFVGAGAHGSPSSGRRGHRRTRNQLLQTEKSRSTPELTNISGGGRNSNPDQERDILSVEEALRLGIGKERSKDRPVPSSQGDGKDRHRRDGDTGSDSSNKSYGHRRKRSKELGAQVSDWKKEDGVREERKESLKSEDDDGNLRSEEDGAPGPSSVKEGSPQPGQPVLDARRRRHSSSGSRPSSPIIVLGDRGPTEEKPRMSVADMMMEQKAKNLNKSSSLNSLSGRSEDGSGGRGEGSRRTPSSESLPGSTRGDGSKRTVSNESLLSGGSSRGDGSKRTQSNESLMSIRTDTSKRSHSNESLPGSARTESSRRSPSNESLPESIREETEQDSSLCTSDTHTLSSSYQSNPSCRRSQSVGSAKDLGQRGEESGHEKKEQEGTSSMVSKLLLRLENITKSNSSSVKKKKESLMRKRSNEETETGGSKPPSDDERRSGRRSRNHSESDAEGGASDAGSQLPPRAPSDSSSGSHSDDNRHQRRGHRRTPSDHRPPPSLPPEADPMRPIHSPIIMEGGMTKKSSSNVRRNQSFHGLLPSKHADTKISPSSTEESPPKPEEQAAQAQSANSEPK